MLEILARSIMKIFLNEVSKNRERLKSFVERRCFWNENKRNFDVNIAKIVKIIKLPKGWKIYLATGNFISNKKIMPYDYDSWSNTVLVAATKKQGHEIMIFFNRARAEFLSLPALLPLIIHEIEHVKQLAKSPTAYLKGIYNDELSRKLEIEAEKPIKKISINFRKEALIESILYCYDTGSWKAAQRMANFLNKELADIYSGGYDQGMSNEQYKIFVEAKKQKNINLFINSLFEAL